MGLSFDYALLNLGRRPTRTVLTAVSSALVAALLVCTAAFVRGLEQSFTGAAQPDVALLLSRVAEGDVLRSSVQAGLGALVRANVPGVAVVSEEVHLACNVTVPGSDGARAAMVRGVTPAAYQVHDAVTLTEGTLPGPGEVLVGRLLARQMRVDPSRLAVGETLVLEGAKHRVSGHFAAPGTAIEAEMWTPLEALRGIARRPDASVVFARLEPGADARALQLFVDRRLDLELSLLTSEQYYADLARYLAPIRALAMAMAALIAGAAFLGGVNTAAAAVQDRIRELATLRALGFSTGALWRSLAQEAVLLGSFGALLGLAAARLFLDGGAVRLAMGAFTLGVDGPALALATVATLALALLGTLPALLRLHRLPIAAALAED
ncbi:MAG: FtsX-like permease family protein [Planctomycetaceae bacterium]|nr:FtsX-like permease family protein [Planctomycetaceae bacterium]